MLHSPFFRCDQLKQLCLDWKLMPSTMLGLLIQPLIPYLELKTTGGQQGNKYPECFLIWYLHVYLTGTRLVAALNRFFQIHCRLLLVIESDWWICCLHPIYSAELADSLGFKILWNRLGLQGVSCHHFGANLDIVLNQKLSQPLLGYGHCQPVWILHHCCGLLLPI